MAEVRRVVVASYRLGGADGVSTESAKWIRALGQLGCHVSTLAGEGRADVLDPGLAAGHYVTGRAAPPPDRQRLAAELAGADLVVVENLCSLPLNPQAGAAMADALRGRPAVLRHHDLPWQREAFASYPAPPDDPAWAHIVVNDFSRHELAARGITAMTVRNTFDPRPPAGDRQALRRALGVKSGQVLALHPARAIARKGVPEALALAEHLGAFYWLTGPAEEGFGPTVEALLSRARVPVHWGPLEGLAGAPQGMEHAYAACDLVVFPSVQEGFGNPPVEAALHRRPAAVGHYRAADELRELGFCWLGPDQPELVSEHMRAGPSSSRAAHMLDHNAEVARRHLNMDDLPGQLTSVMAQLRLRPPRPVALSLGDGLN